MTEISILKIEKRRKVERFFPYFLQSVEGVLFRHPNLLMLIVAPSLLTDSGRHMLPDTQHIIRPPISNIIFPNHLLTLPFYTYSDCFSRLHIYLPLLSPQSLRIELKLLETFHQSGAFFILNSRCFPGEKGSG